MASVKTFPTLAGNNPMGAFSDPFTRVDATGIDATGNGTFMWKVRADLGAVRAHRNGLLPFTDIPAEMTVTGTQVDKVTTSAVISIAAAGQVGTATVQRFNKATEGSGMSLGKYHRTGTTALKVPRPGSKRGVWIDLPAMVSIRRVPTYTTEVWEVVAVASSERKVAIKPVAVRSTTLSTGRKARKAPGASVATRTPLASSKAPEGRSVAPAGPGGALKVKAADPHRVDPTGLFRFPTLSETNQIVIERETLLELDMLWSKHLKGDREVIALTGPTGTGKTSLAMGLAARHGVGVFKLDVSGNREFSDWTGVLQARDGETTFVWSGFLEAIDADGRYAGIPRIIILDEANRAMSSSASNALLAVCDGFNTLWVPDLGRAVNLDPAVLIIMTLNRGSQYSGTSAMDLALTNRVTSWYEMGFLDAPRESALIVERTGIDQDKAMRLVQAATQIRLADSRGELPEGGGISIRQVLEAASKVASGFTLHAAAKRAWAGAYSSEGGTASEQAIVNSAIDGVLR